MGSSALGGSFGICSQEFLIAEELVYNKNSRLNQYSCTHLPIAFIPSSLSYLNSSFDQEKSTMKAIMAETQQKIAFLEEELETKVKLVTATEKVLDETQSNLYNLRANYEEETNSAASLRKELESANAELAQVQESTKQASLRDIAGQQGRDDVASAAVDAAAKRQIQTLQSRADALAAQLEAANERALSSERKLEEYEKREESTSDTLLQSSTEVQARQDELAALRVELATTKENAKSAAAKQSRRANELARELEEAKKQYGDSLAEANRVDDDAGSSADEGRGR